MFHDFAGSRSEIAELRARRSSLAEALLAADGPTAGAIESNVRIISGIIDCYINALWPTEEERGTYAAFLDRASDCDHPDLAALWYLAAGMYEPAHHAPFLFDVTASSPPVRAALIQYLAQKPLIFKYRGEPERYTAQLEKLYDYLARVITGQGGFLPQAEIGQFLYGISCLPCLSADANLKPLMSARARAHRLFLELELDPALISPLPGAKLIGGPGELQDPLGLLMSNGFGGTGVGFLAANYRPTANTWFVLPHVEAFHHEGVPVTLYTTASDIEDPVLEACSAQGAKVVALGSMSFSDQIQAIRGAQHAAVFIASNVVGHFDPVCRLANVSLSRCQIVLAASPCTTGMPSSTHVLTSATSEDSDSQFRDASYSETPILIDGLFCCFHPAMLPDGRPEPLRDLVSEQGRYEHILFSNCNISKIHPEVLDTWMACLEENTSARLVLAPFNPTWTKLTGHVDIVRTYVSDALQLRNCSSDQVLIMLPSESFQPIRDMTEACDVYLDAWPFSSCSSLVWPVLHQRPFVVLEGRYQRSRQAAAIARAVGLEELVCSDPTAYRSTVRKLLADPSYRAALSQKIRQNVTSSRMFDTRDFAGRLMRALPL